MPPHKKVIAAMPPPPAPLPEFVQGAMWALSQLGEVLWERRQGMRRLETAIRNVPEADQRIISDILEPLSGGVQENVLSTVKRRLEERIMAECQRRMDERRSKAVREGGE
jgi:hypothetical protein